MVQVMETRDRYLKKALECTSAADQTHDSAERLKLLSIAHLFMKLAEHVAGRLDRGTAHRPVAQPDQSTENDS
jgi:hypothetical protein